MKVSCSDDAIPRLELQWPSPAAVLILYASHRDAAVFLRHASDIAELLRSGNCKHRVSSSNHPNPHHTEAPFVKPTTPPWTCKAASVFMTLDPSQPRILMSLRNGLLASGEITGSETK